MSKSSGRPEIPGTEVRTSGVGKEGNTPQSPPVSHEPAALNPDLIQVRRDGAVLQMDLQTLITLIQQNAVTAANEIKSPQMTKDEWRKLAELEIYRTFSPTERAKTPGRSGTMPLPPAAGSASASLAHGTPEENLDRFFASLAIPQLRIDSLIAVISAVVVAGLSVVTHGSVIVLIAMALGWGLGYILADQLLFLRWIQGIRMSGFKRLPWQSRWFLIVAVILAGYFTIASLLPRIPEEGSLRLIDSVVGFLFSVAAAAVWDFSVATVSMKRTFELTREPRQPKEPDKPGPKQTGTGGQE